MLYSQTMASLRDRDSHRKEDKVPVPKVSFVRRLDCIILGSAIDIIDLRDQSGLSRSQVTSCYVTPRGLAPRIKINQDAAPGVRNALNYNYVILITALVGAHRIELYPDVSRLKITSRNQPALYFLATTDYIKGRSSASLEYNGI